MKSVYSAGRAPWYDVNSPQQRRAPFIVGVAGGTASGKSTVCKAILDRLDVQWVAILPTDSFYRALSHEEHERAAQGLVNFDHPNAFDWTLLRETLRALKRCEQVRVPHYNFVTHSREPGQSTVVYGADVLIVEGIMALYDPEVRAELDMRIFVDTDSDVRLCRRLRRDIAERGRDVDSVLTQYERYVKPAYDEFVLPTKQFADIIVPRGAENVVAIDLIATHVANKLRNRAREQHAESPAVRSSMARALSSTCLEDMPRGVFELPEKKTTALVVTQLRDRQTERADFIHFADRLTHQTLEMALGLLPMESRDVKTPTGSYFSGLVQQGELCAVSVMRAGDAIVNNLRKIVRRAHYGQILIQSDSEKNPALFYVKLPPEIAQYPVFICDPLMATGQTMTMAVRVLLDHGVRESNIIVVTLFASLGSIATIKAAFPEVRVCTAVIEKEIDEKTGFLKPGVGQFTNRYYGTEPDEQN